MKTLNVALTPKNFDISNEEKAKAVWLIKKYTSYVWIKRMKEALDAFSTEYEAYISMKGALEWRVKVLQVLQGSSAMIQDGLACFEKGEMQKGSDIILDGLYFREYLVDPHIELALNHFEIGCRRLPQESVGIYRIAELALRMALETELSFSGAQTLPRILDDADLPEDISERIDPLAPISTKIIGFDEEITESGIWLPINHPFGCPNYFEAGYSENTFEYPETEIRTWENEEDYIKGSPPNKRNLVYDEMNGKFILLWKEDRYKKGRIPDESVYLDPSTEIPDEQLVLFPPKK